MIIPVIIPLRTFPVKVVDGSIYFHVKPDEIESIVAMLPQER